MTLKKILLISILLASCILTIITSCQTKSSNCPCQIPRNPVSPKDAYYQTYYESSPDR